ncbi:hypothetical protein SEA_AYOTOYA_60 [Gordonia phage Ayotoya]|nr:hypothetical protein SEA_AYOTOYA_60 [Gordonia phage Ayotoya]URP21287.1 hypothetical protein SEA_CHOP_60 [Gordonia phage Chop]UXL91335.1 hypothetical protein SEA_GRANDSLAM_60 [Gordonia phage GrandSlam]
MTEQLSTTNQLATTYARIVANLRRSAWPAGYPAERTDLDYVSGDFDDEQAEAGDAGVVGSAVVDANGEPTGRYKILLDLDVDAVLIPSSHDGHHHLLIDREVSKAQHDVILTVLGMVGVVQPGYVQASIERSTEGAALRTPWTVKETTTDRRRTWGARFRGYVKAAAGAPTTQAAGGDL